MPGVVVVPASGSGSGTTFRDLYIDLADELGFMAQVTVSAQASNTEASRTVLVDAFGDDEADEGEIGGWWLYVLTGAYAGTQRRVMKRGWLGNDRALYLNRSLPGLLAADVQVLVTYPLPIARYQGIKGCKTLVNEALNRILVEARLETTGDGTDQWNLSAYSWLRSLDQTTGLYDRLNGTPTTNAMAPARYGYRLDVNGADVTLVTDWMYADGTAFQLGVITEADRFIFDGSAWGFSATRGLSDDDDQAAAPREWVRSFGMVKALQHLERVIERDPRLSDTEKARQSAIVAARKPVYVRAANRVIIDGFPRSYAPPHESLLSTNTSVPRIGQAIPNDGWLAL